jgi:TonB-linked SusC/RagA family outer membrane protein
MRIFVNLTLLLMVFFSAPAIADNHSTQQQSKSISGVVLDENGELVIGANVSVPGTPLGTVTDLNGKFTLSNIPMDKSSIRITYLGYEPQLVSIANGNEFIVKLVPSEQVLDELVVVGYGSQRVKDLTGAATAIKMDDIITLPGASIVDALSGQVVGLSVKRSSGRPGATGTFKVRQPVTFDDSNAAFNQPLIVVDDVVQVNDLGEPTMTVFNMLDYSEIESMTVLKDASAAVYGSRASAGVILVKTKRGVVGTPKISYSAKLDFSDAISHIQTMNAYETGVFTNRMIKQIYANGGANNTNYLYSDEELNRLKSLNYNWLDEAWHSALSQRHSLTVNGGSDKVTYFAGLNYQTQETNLGKVQDFDKWTFRAGGEMKVTAGLKLSASVSGYSTDKIDVNDQANTSGSPGGTSDYSQLRHVPKYIPTTTDVLDPATNQIKNYYVSPWVGPHSVNVSTDANVGSGYAVWNFFANEASNARKVTDENGWNANFSLIYDVPFIKGLQIKGTYALGYNNTYTNQIGDYYTVARATNTNEAGMHLLGDYTQWNFLNYGDPNGSDVNKKPTIKYNKITRKTEQVNLMLTYNRAFGLHDVGLTGVIERGENEGIEEQLWYRGPGLSYNGVSSTAGTLSTNGSETYLKKFESGSLSYVGRANYKFNNRYLFQFIVRADASTKFAPENYWGIFPTGSLGWVLSEEDFFKNSNFSKYIDFLKFRFSLGQTGKDNVEAWKWMQIYKISATGGLGFGQIGGQPASGASTNGTANRDVRWDTSTKQNYGIDIDLLRNRLSISTDYYYDKTKDLIMLISDTEEPIYIGAAVPPINYGKKDAWGWEFSIRWRDEIKQSLIPSWGPIKYAVGMDYGISWNKTVLGQLEVFDFPSYIDEDRYTGYHSPSGVWGFRTWKHTSSGDGMLRNQEDIDKYWQYLTDLAEASGVTPSYLGITSKSKMFPGMIAYEDQAGKIDVLNKTIAGPDGVISREHGDDYVRLGDDRRHGINTKLNFQWGNLSLSTQLNTSWGGFVTIYNDFTQGISSSNMIWAQLSYVNDMFDPTENPNGKYPSMAVSNTYGEHSDFWQVSSFRMYVRNMVLAYSVPSKWLKRTGIDRVQFSLTGDNLWDFYNPYPDRFRNMYDDVRTSANYPTLRTWTMGVNLTF